MTLYMALSELQRHKLALPYLHSNYLGHHIQEYIKVNYSPGINAPAETVFPYMLCILTLQLDICVLFGYLYLDLNM